MPLGPKRIASLLQEAGFDAPMRYSGWDGQSFNEGMDQFCVTVARTY
jgi:hypothetical protein